MNFIQFNQFYFYQILFSISFLDSILMVQKQKIHL